MSAIVELVRKGIIEDASSAEPRRVFAMAMALCEPPIVEVQATLDLRVDQPRFVVQGDEVRTSYLAKARQAYTRWAEDEQAAKRNRELML